MSCLKEKVKVRETLLVAQLSAGLIIHSIGTCYPTFGPDLIATGLYGSVAEFQELNCIYLNVKKTYDKESVIRQTKYIDGFFSQFLIAFHFILIFIYYLIIYLFIYH